MAISGDYPSPVLVNGYSCKNCTDVDNAKKHIDPAHPKDGPYGTSKPEGVSGGDRAREAASVVSFGGGLTAPPTALDSSARPRSTTGARLNISV